MICPFSRDQNPKMSSRALHFGVVVGLWRLLDSATPVKHVATAGGGGIGEREKEAGGTCEKWLRHPAGAEPRMPQKPPACGSVDIPEIAPNCNLCHRWSRQVHQGLFLKNLWTGHDNVDSLLFVGMWCSWIGRITRERRLCIEWKIENCLASS